MALVRRSALAEEDFKEIWRYIAVDSPDAADNLLRKIDVKLEFYAEQPRIGSLRDNLIPGLRSFPIGNYLVFYRIVHDGIELVRVLHGSQNLQDLFRLMKQS